MPTGAARFVAIANGKYTVLAPLPRAVDDAQALATLLQARHDFEPVVLPSLERGALLDAIDKHLPVSGANDSTLIVSWTGHGEVGAGGVLRLIGCSAGNDVEVATPAKLGEWAARTGARQVLVLVDTCFSGGGILDAIGLANTVDDGRKVPGVTWFGVVAASLGDEPALSGALSRELQRLLSHGPREPDFRWDRSRPYIRGDDLVQALLADWGEPRQTPRQASSGRAWDLVKNPLHVAGLGDQPVEHLLRAARGSAGEESFFTGREQALSQLVAWMDLETPGLFVVTGPAGCGKSAVVGRIVSLSSPSERARLLKSENIPATLDPGVDSVDAQLQAHGATVDTTVDELVRQLGTDPSQRLYGVLTLALARRNAGRPLTIVIDGLDEARIYLRDLMLEVLQPLAREARLVVATRDVPLEDDSLVGMLNAGAQVVDLGDVASGTPQDIHRYVMRRLSGVGASMDAAQVADALAPPTGPAGASVSFLLARLITSQLRDEPVDTTLADWRLTLSSTAENALERDLQSVPLVVDGVTQAPGVARHLLRALAHAHGGGFPADDVWPAVASALSAGRANYGRGEAFGVLSAFGRHIVASSEGNQPVYRIAHQQLVDYLTADAARDPERPPTFDTATAIAGAIFDTYRGWLDDGGAPREAGYLWRFAWLHLAEGGPSGLALLERLAEQDAQAFLPDLASGYEFAAGRLWNAGEAKPSLDLYEKATAVCRRLDDPRRLAMALFHLSIVRSTVGDEEGASSAADEAARVIHPLRHDPANRAVLGSALCTRALSQLRDGRLTSARRLACELIALEEASPQQDDDSRARLSSAYVIAAQAALATGDLADAARRAHQAVALVDTDEDEAGSIVLLEALSVMAVVQFMQAALLLPDEQGRWPVATAGAGERVMKMFERNGPQGAMSDVLVAKAFLSRAQTEMLNQTRHRPESAPDAQCLALLDQAIALVRPHAARIVDAALLCANLIRARALPDAGRDLPAVMALLDESIADLRSFKPRSLLIDVEFGTQLAARTTLMLPQYIAGQPVDLEALTAGQQEAVALLHRSDAALLKPQLAQALTHLSLLLQAASADRARAAREEAIQVLRELAPGSPPARLQLVGLLIDQAAQLINGRTAEAADLAHEALAAAEALPPSPTAEFFKAASEVTLAGTQLTLELPEEARGLLTSAIARLETADPSPIVTATLAPAYVNLALIEIAEQHHREAKAHARRAIALFDSPNLPPMTATARLLAHVALGSAERGTGDAAKGTATLQQVIGRLPDVAASDESDLKIIVGALDRAAPDLWSETMAALARWPLLVRNLTLVRRRPAAELDATVQALIDALETAEPEGQREIREIARMHNRLHPGAFEQAWARLDGGTTPAWLAIDPAIEWATIGWLNTPTWALSRDYLATHPILLDASTDIVVEEFALAGNGREVMDRHLALLAAAREGGVEQAYAPLLRAIEISDWVRSADPRDHLAKRDALLRPEVLESLRSQAAQGDPAARTFAAILELAQRGETDLAFDATEHPSAMGDQLRAASESSDAARLQALATITFHCADAGASQRQAAVALLIARAVLDRPEPEPELQAALAAIEPGERAGLVALVLGAVARHPAAAGTLVTLLPLLDGPAPPPG